MSGFFGVASKEDCVLELFYGVDYHSHLGTRRGGMAVHGEDGFDRAIHNIENTPFRTKFDKDVGNMKGISVFDVSHIMNRSRCCSVLRLEVLVLHLSVKLIIMRNYWKTCIADLRHTFRK